MPLYTVTTQIGVLSAEAKAKLAAEVTTLHSEYSPDRRCCRARPVTGNVRNVGGGGRNQR
jgi:hypothetical protein